MAEVNKASGGAVQYEVEQWRDINDIPVKADGFDYSVEQYVNLWRAGGPFHTADSADYPKILATQGVAPLVSDGTIDEVWMFGAPYFGYSESSMAGPRSFFINGTGYPNVESSRPFAIMGFNYERGVGEMVHDLGHRTEDSVSRAYGGWNVGTPTKPFDLFAANYGQSPAPYGVGSTHFPANGASDYDYGNARVVQSTAQDWLNYPNLTGATAPVSVLSWSAGSGADNQRDYLGWMFGHLPRNTGVTADGRQSNWWKYLFDFDDYEATTGLPNAGRESLVSGDLNSLGASSFQIKVAYSSAIAIQSASLTSQDISIRTPKGVVVPVTLSAVNDIRDGNYRVATYTLAAPGGTWDLSDAGIYTVLLNANQVTTTDGASLPSGQIGTFNVARGAAIDVNAMVIGGQATVTSTPSDIGLPADIFDGDTETLCRSASVNPAVFTIRFNTPVAVGRSRVMPAGGQHQWTVESANSLPDLDGKTGSYRLLIGPATITGDQYTEATIGKASPATFYRLTVRKLNGDNFVHVREWQLFTTPPAPLDTTPPTATLTPVTPDPRNQSVGTVKITFSEVVTGFSLSDLILTRNGGPNLLTSAQTLTSSDQKTFYIGNLTGLTGINGSYIVTLKAAGVTDLAGNKVAADVNDAWLMDTVAPKATITPVTPDPRNKSVTSVKIVFSEAVTGFSLSDMTLTRNGGANLFTSTQTLTSSDHKTFVLGNLTSITGAGGSYILTLKHAGVTDLAGNQVAANVSDAWLTDTVAPKATITPVTPDPRNSGVASVRITFSETVTGFNLSDLTLTRNGGANLLNSTQTLSTSDHKTFVLGNLVKLTAATGHYVLTLKGAGVADMASNVVLTNISDSWLVVTTLD